LVLELKNVWEVCEFEDDIKYGRLEAARFAVELYSVLQGKADKVYTDPRLFLTHTYLAENMKYLLKEALRRLSGKGGQPVIVLDTEFGGGKTHTILLLYHVFKSRGVGTKFI
jgi:predicted AAA+ superfamily ATPase